MEMLGINHHIYFKIMFWNNNPLSQGALNLHIGTFKKSTHVKLDLETSSQLLT